MSLYFPCSYLILGSSIHCRLNTFLQDNLKVNSPRHLAWGLQKYCAAAGAYVARMWLVCGTGTISPHNIYNMHRIYNNNNNNREREMGSNSLPTDTNLTYTLLHHTLCNRLQTVISVWWVLAEELEGLLSPKTTKFQVD